MYKAFGKAAPEGAAGALDLELLAVCWIGPGSAVIDQCRRGYPKLNLVLLLAATTGIN
eukprot:SAG31_NODE_76_length_27534_cov_13.661868_9_plen_58_part_00